MNRRNILRGVAQSNLSAPPAALIYHAVLCCIFAVSLSIIHETQIPFTFFRDFLKKVFGALSVKAWRLCQLSQRESQLRLDFQRHLPPKSLPKAPVSLADALASPSGELSSECETERAHPHQKAPPSLKGAMGALCPITMGSAYSALGASGAFASSAFAAGSAGAAGAAAGFGACFTTGLGGFGSSFSGKRMMCLGHF